MIIMQKLCNDAVPELCQSYKISLISLNVNARLCMLNRLLHSMRIHIYERRKLSFLSISLSLSLSLPRSLSLSQTFPFSHVSFFLNHVCFILEFNKLISLSNLHELIICLFFPIMFLLLFRSVPWHALTSDWNTPADVTYR